VIGNLVVDFDGTACPVDVSEALLREFAAPGWDALDDLLGRGHIGLRQTLRGQAALLEASPAGMVAFALERFALDPSFPPFVRWAGAAGLPVTVVSDGLGLHVRPMLRREGLEHPAGHPECIGCGTCKMLAVASARERHGPVAFVGDGVSDRYGALYADLVFAKRSLATLCNRDGIPFVEWETFDDVREVLESSTGPWRAVAPAHCPGWTTAVS
jgi:2-hydroxy-3-keto-5-methylthiopentenyl-1-phosphate phosphatase